jgi:hypothetical protein
LLIFNGTVASSSNSQRALNAHAHGGADGIIFAGAVGADFPLGSLTTSGATQINGGLVRTTGDQTYTNRVSLGANTILAGNDISFNGTLDSIGVPRSLEVITTGGGVTTFGGNVGGGSLAIAALTTNADGATQINGSGVFTSGNQSYHDPVTLNSSINSTGFRSTAGSVIFNNTLDSFQLDEEDVRIDALIETVFGDAVGTAVNGALATLVTNNSNTNRTGTTRINAGTVITKAFQMYQENVTLNSASNTTIFSGTTIRFGGTVNSFQLNEETLSITAAPAIFDGAVGTAVNGALASLTMHAHPETFAWTQINGGVVTTHGDQIYKDRIELGANTILNANDVDFNGTLDSLRGNRHLTVNTSADGTTTFGGAVGAVFPLESVFTNADGVTRINGGQLNTTGFQQYNDPVTLNAAANSTTITSSTFTVRFEDTVNSFQGNEENLTVNSAMGVLFSGTVGGAPSGALANLKVVTEGDILLREINVMDTADLTTGGEFLDLNGGAINIIATSLIASAVTGIELETTISNLSATNTFLDGIHITETDDLNILTVTASGHTVTLNVGGSITDGNGSSVNITADALFANSVTGISLDTLIEDLHANNTMAGGIDINEVDDVAAVSVSAPSQTVGITAGGEIDALSVFASTATLTAGAAINSSIGGRNIFSPILIAFAVTGISLETAIDELTAINTTSGGIEVRDANDLNVVTVTAPSKCCIQRSHR